MRALYFHTSAGRSTARGKDASTLQAALARAGVVFEDVSVPGAIKEAGNAGRRQRLDATRALVSRLVAAPVDQRPELWLSEAVSRFAPDWLGPAVSQALSIPYVLIEPELGASSRADGLTDHRWQGELLRHAAAVITMDRARAAQMTPWLRDADALVLLEPVVDLGRIRAAVHARSAHRAALRSALRFPEETPWLLVDGPAYYGDAQASYGLIVRALSRLPGLDWRLVVASDGPAWKDIAASMLQLPADRVRLWPVPSPTERLALIVSSDLFLWPALGDAGAASMLEAQAAGVAVVGCRNDVGADRVVDGRTGRLTEAGNAEAFANVVAFLLRHPHFRRSFGDEARRVTVSDHHIGRAVPRLVRLIEYLRVGAEREGRIPS